MNSLNPYTKAAGEHLFRLASAGQISPDFEVSTSEFTTLIQGEYVTISIHEGETVEEAQVTNTSLSLNGTDTAIFEAYAREMAQVSSILLSLHIAILTAATTK